MSRLPMTPEKRQAKRDGWQPLIPSDYREPLKQSQWEGLETPAELQEIIDDHERETIERYFDLTNAQT